MKIVRALVAGFVLAAAAVAQTPGESDFVPGEKIVLFDDFSDTQTGGKPRYWEPGEGPGVAGAPGGVMLKDNHITAKAVKYPKYFTAETEFSFTSDSSSLWWHFDGTGKAVELKLWVSRAAEGQSCHVGLADYDANLQEADVPCRSDGKNSVALWYQGGRVRVYINGQKTVDANAPHFDQLQQLWIDALGGFQITSVRVAESSPDIGQILLSTGKYVSRAIQFDTASDRLKPDSMAIIQQLAAALSKETAVKVRISGHTDSTGDAAKNLDLSKRRAESVKTALVGIGIAADRLSTEGFGQTKPVSPNTTPLGRAENRRVEFTKL